jgi:predicted GIY-YIG superfamily endonuclease
MVGIYAIVNEINGKRYIGSTNKFESRFKQHLWNLRKNKHDNKKLQFAYDEYYPADRPRNRSTWPPSRNR